MNAVEDVSEFSVNGSWASDFEGNHNFFALVHQRDVPSEMCSIFAFFTGHFTVISLVSVTTDKPVFNLEIFWNDVLECDVFQSSVAFIVEHNQDFMPSLSADFLCHLTSTELSSVVDDVDGRCFSCVSGTNWSVPFCAEFSSSRCAYREAFVFSWTGCNQFVVDGHVLSRFEAYWTACSDRNGVGETITIR